MSEVFNDVTALVLSVGEPSLARALAALDTQTRPPAQRVLIENVDGFDLAFNRGVAQVTTALVLQCDADMILDPDCLDVLRGAMRDDAGLCLAKLEDPLLGPIEGIKMFRTAVLRQFPLTPTLTTETDHVASMLAAGHAVVHATRSAPRHEHAIDILGVHQPAYDDPACVWDRCVRVGRKARLRRRPQVFRRYLAALRTSVHPSAELALIALCRGFADTNAADRHDRMHHPPELTELLDLLRARDGQ